MDPSFLFIILLAHFIGLPPFSVIQFCDDQFLMKSRLYLDTYKALTRRTRCDCFLTSDRDTIITLSTKDYPSHTTTLCNTTSRIEYHIVDVSGTSDIICGNAIKQIGIRRGQHLYVTFYNEQENLENYCLNVKTAPSAHILRVACRSDTSVAADKSTNPATTSKQLTTKQRQEEAYTSFTTKHQGIDTTTSVYSTTIVTTTDVTVQGDTTPNAASPGDTITVGTTTDDASTIDTTTVGVPLTILLPLVFGWLFFIIVVAIGVIYFIRRNKRDNQTVQSKHIERAVDEDEANHTEQALVNMEDEYTVIGEKSGVSEQVRETNTDDIGECSEVSPQSTVVVTAKDGSGCNEDDEYLMPHDIKMKDSEPGSVYVTLANDNENGKEQDYTSLEPGSVYTTLNKERNDQQEYTTMAFGKGKKRQHRCEPTKK